MLSFYGSEGIGSGSIERIWSTLHVHAGKAGAEYNPQQDEQPLDSRMTFTPADFCIGESGIWFFSLQREDGSAAPPVEFLDDRNIVRDE